MEHRTVFSCLEIMTVLYGAVFYVYVPFNRDSIQYDKVFLISSRRNKNIRWHVIF